MCGIAGLYNLSRADAIESMLQAISMRGPDDCQMLVDKENNVSLGHRRLSIIDLSTCGRQPMTDASGRFSIVYNGEVYNYLELKRDLEELGYAFHSQTDTEVVLTAYRQWGRNCLSRLRGMFSLAILDRGRGYGESNLDEDSLAQSPCLILARDRFGIKPLLYAKVGDGFIFASELKALLASNLVDGRISPEAVVEYLSYGAISQPKTILQGVFQLEPGVAMIVSEGGKKVTCHRFWDLARSVQAQKELIKDADYVELVKQTRCLLEEATKYHLLADVRIGAFLSGGVDSTAVCALMQSVSRKPVQTYSVGFHGSVEVTDESGFAEKVAAQIGCEHTSVVVSDREVADSFNTIIQALDQPSIDGTNTYLVSQAAARDVKVAISGTGGDELFAGYPHFRRYQKAAGDEVRPLDHAASTLHQMRPSRFTAKGAYRFATREQRLTMMRNLTPMSQLRGQLSESLAASCNPLTHPVVAQKDLPLWDPVAQLSYAECKGYLKNTLLRDSDVMSMANSLELRPILLDHKLAEFALALPPEAKIRSGQMKAALVDAVADLIPAACWQRPKTGFELPFVAWMTGSLRPALEAAFNNFYAEAIFSKEYLRKVKRKIKNGSIPRKVWAPFVLLSWMDQSRCHL